MRPQAAWVISFLMLAPTGSVALAGAPPDGSQPIDAALLVDTQAIEPGKPFRVGILMKIEPGWHTYWRDPGDSGAPTEVRWQLPPGFVAGELQWPAHKRFELPGGLYNNGYDGEVLLFATITPPAEIESPTVSIGAEATWLVCSEDQCLPGSAVQSREVPVGVAQAGDAMPIFEHWSARVPATPATGPAR